MPERLEKMHLFSLCRSKEPIPQNGPYPPRRLSITPVTGSITAREPGMIAMLNQLAHTLPRTVPVSELLETVRKVRNITPEQFESAKVPLMRDMTNYVMTYIMLLYKTPPRFGTEPGQRPCVSPLARYCCRRNGMSRITGMNRLSLIPRRRCSSSCAMARERKRT